MDNLYVINLQNLPLEVLFAIFEYLSPLPAKVAPSSSITPQPHPFLALSITSLTLRSTLISFLRGRILGHNHVSSPATTIAPFTKLRTALADNPEDTSQYAPVILRVWLRATMTHCFACGKCTRRRAIMEPTTVCCGQCDLVHWPNKITMTDAIKKYDLGKGELFGGMLPNSLGGPPEESLAKGGLIPQRRGLPYGQKFVSAILTTMFMEDDVRELACKKHQCVDVDEYLRFKSDRRGARQASIAENREKRLDYIRRLTHSNGLATDVTIARYSYFLSKYDHKGLHHRRPKQVFLNLLRGDLVLKKMGITFPQNMTAARWGYNCHLDTSSSRCCALITGLKQDNYFCGSKTFVLGVDECCFKRRLYVVQTQVPGEPGQYDFTFSDASSGSPPLNSHGGLSWAPQFTISSSLPVMPVKNFSRNVKDEDIQQLVYYRNLSDIAPVVRDSQYCQLQERADPIDFCLFEEYIQEFGVEGVPRPSFSYAQLRDVWRAKSVDIKSEDGRTLCNVFNAPWSWLRYPLFIKDVPEANYSPTMISEQTHDSTLHTPLLEEEQQNCDKRRRRADLFIGNKNYRKEQEFEDLGRAIRTVVRKCGWDLLAVNGGDSWDKAVRSVLAGMK